MLVLLLDDKVFLNDFDQTQEQNRELSCFIHTKMKRAKKVTMALVKERNFIV